MEKTVPKERTAETYRTDHPKCNGDLFILSSDESSNKFSRNPPPKRTEVIIHCNTPVTRTV
jgi:hypothetical protein